MFLQRLFQRIGSLPTKRISSMQKPRRMALLIQWRDKGYTRPCYGIVDDDELFLTGSSTFLGTDGKQLIATPNDLLLLDMAAVPLEVVPASHA
jgi:hypothetical protein